MKKVVVSSLSVLALASSSLLAHSALMSCFDNGDGTITCEGGFSDGSSASGVVFRITQNGKNLMETKFNEDGEVTFEKPNGSYTTVFYGGEGHLVEVKGEDILE